MKHPPAPFSPRGKPALAHGNRRPQRRGPARRLALMLAGLLLLPVALRAADAHYPVGETLVYTIRWGLLACGTSTISCDEVKVDGRDLIRIRVRVRSNWLVSAIYPVDDTVDCYVDPETQHSIRLEKNTSEGGFICRDVLEIDRVNHRATWTSHTRNITTNYPIEAAACDAVSFQYAFRRDTFRENQSRDYTLVVDSALHGITVTAKGTDQKSIRNYGKVHCRKYVVAPLREDLFVRKIPKEIWLTEDDRKLMVRMDVKVPVGKVRLVLDEYMP